MSDSTSNIIIESTLDSMSDSTSNIVIESTPDIMSDNKSDNKSTKPTKKIIKKVKSNDKSKKYKKKSDLDDQHANRIHNCVRNRINFISGTVTPAQSNKNREGTYQLDDIECLDVGIHYLFETYDRSVTLSIQPKFMGSRCNVYLFRNDCINRSYAVSRNGYRITKLSREELIPIYDKLHKHLFSFMTDNKITMMIIDGELLPWSVLGKDLIVNEYLPVDKGLETEIAYMKKYKFDDQLQKIKTDVEKNLFEVTDSITSQKLYDVYCTTNRSNYMRESILMGYLQLIPTNHL